MKLIKKKKGVPLIWKPLKRKKVNFNLKANSNFAKIFKPKYKRTLAERKLIRKNPWGDRDKDLVPNWIDCKPLDRMKQGILRIRKNPPLKHVKPDIFESDFAREFGFDKPAKIRYPRGRPKKGYAEKIMNENIMDAYDDEDTESNKKLNRLMQKQYTADKIEAELEKEKDERNIEMRKKISKIGKPSLSSAEKFIKIIQEANEKEVN